MHQSNPSRRRFVQGMLAAGAGTALGPRRSFGGPAGVPPIPEIDLWKSQMLKYGELHRQGFADVTGPLDPLLGATYYDAQRVFLQIADYTGNPLWLDAASRAMTVYRDRYVLPNRGGVPGYWIFPHGLAMDSQRRHDPKSRDAVVQMSRNAAFAGDATPTSATQNAEMSREVAYSLMCLLKAEELGEPRRERRQLLMNQALGHVDQWFVSRTAEYVQPFMFALTAEALILCYNHVQDPRIPQALRIGADWISKNMWVRDARAFQYIDRSDDPGATGPAPDLNLLIAPVFAWLYRLTGDAKYRDQGDAVFAGGVKGAWLGGAKQFNQNYRWSFDYVAWRSAGPMEPQRIRR